jgi:HEAT repeat protein
MKVMVLAAGLIVLAGVPGAARFSQAQPAQAVEKAEVAKAIEGARVFRDAGLLAEASSAMTPILKKYPGNSDAARFHIDTLLAQGHFDDSLIVYDAYVKARQRPDAIALAAIGRSDLRRTQQVKSDKPSTVALVLERLARDGDADALRSLKQLSAAAPSFSLEDLAPTISLARLNDAEAQTALGRALSQASSDMKPQVILAIQEANARSLGPAIRAAFGDSDQNVRNRAALALGTLQIREAVPELQNAFDNAGANGGATKMFAAIALKQLGQTSVDKFVETQLLDSPIPEIRMYAAGAYQFSTTKTPQWDKAVRALMSGPNELQRLQAAELLACCDLVAARSLLTSALSSPNPILRAGAAKIFESRKDLADLTVARRIIGDSLDLVRLHGDGIAMTLAKSAQ